MAKQYDAIDDRLRAWIAAQPLFFVATAPLAGDGHINVSPKGMDGTFAVLGANQVGYLDYFGSGVETIAHLRENGRITVMFCAFDGAPNIVRLHGRGRAVLPTTTASPICVPGLRRHATRACGRSSWSMSIASVTHAVGRCR